MTRAPVTPGTGPVAEAVRRQKAYEDARPTMMGRGFHRFSKPFGAAAARVIPPGLMRQGLAAADRAAGLTIPAQITGHDSDDIDACEAAALRVQAWAVGSNAATGALAGWFGAAGMTADIPATITLAARTVRATGAAFGVTGDTDEDRAFRLMVLELAASGADAKRQETLSTIDRMARVLEDPAARIVLEKGGEWISEQVIDRVLRQVGASLGARKAGQVVPVLGGAVAAAVNASFQTDVARAARYAYRLRWLTRRQLLPPPSDAPDKDIA
jgi:hypothetical protein